MLRKNIKRHKTRWHKGKSTIGANYHHKGLCVDKINGIYLISKAVSGVLYPLHVQKRICGSGSNVVRWESNSCILSHDTAARSDHNILKCPHVQSTPFADELTHIHVEPLTETKLDLLIETHKRIKPEMREMMISLKQAAENISAHPVVPWFLFTKRMLIFIAV